jgi:hypothetical protein
LAKIRIWYIVFRYFGVWAFPSPKTSKYRNCQSLEAISKIGFEAFSSIGRSGKALFAAHIWRESEQEKQRSMNVQDAEKDRKIFLRWLLFLSVL